MKICPKCKKQYEDAWTACTKCNVPLVKEGMERFPPELLSELNELKRLSSFLNERIKKIEGAIDSITRTQEAPAEKIEEVAPLAEERAPEVHERKVEPETVESETQSLETRIGRIWFNRIGIFAIIVGMGFFLKYAFDNNWIGELGRVVLGLLAGLGMIIGGEITHRKNYKIFSEGLIAGGASLLYLSIYAAFNFYHLIGPIAAFVFLIMVTIFIGTFAVRFDSSRVLNLSIIGGFLTPFLISVGGIHPVALMFYILLLDIGILWVSFFKKWEYCNVVALILTYTTYFSWYGIQYKHQYFLAAEIFISSVFILFTIVAILYNFIRKKLTTEGDMAVVIINGIFYFLANYRLLLREHIPFRYLGFISIALAFIYLLFSYSAFTRTKRKDKRLILTYLSLTLLFATISIPIELRYHWITIAFMIESTILIWLGFKIQIKGLRTVGLVLAAIALFRLLFMDFSYSAHYKLNLFFNKRFLTYLILVACALISAYLYRENRDKIYEEERWLPTFLALSACVILLINLSLEISYHFNNLIRAARIPHKGPYPAAEKINLVALRNAQRFSISALWGVYSFTLIIIGIFRKFKALRIMAMILFILTILKVFLIDISEIGRIWRILSFIGLGVVLVVTSLLYQKYRDKIIDFVSKA